MSGECDDDGPDSLQMSAGIPKISEAEWNAICGINEELLRPMSGECEKCGEHALECKCEEFEKWNGIENPINYEGRKFRWEKMQAIKKISRESECDKIKFSRLKCVEKGCRNLQTICLDCGRAVCTKTLPEMQEWINVKTRLPDIGCLVLVHSNDRRIGIVSAYFEGNCSWNQLIYNESRSIPLKDVTHWMPLPEAPHE